MLATFLIALREYLEVFVIIGVFFGISKNLNLKREKELALASITGIVFAFFLPILTFFAGERIGRIIAQKNAELAQGYLLILSGIFIAYVVFSLHGFLRHKRGKSLIFAHQKMQKNIFDISLFGVIVFFIIREGFEIALFSATVSLFSTFLQNLFGLLLGFLVSASVGILTFCAYVRFPIGKMFQYTEYFIVLLGAAMIKNGVTLVFEKQFHIRLESIIPLPLHFIPSDTTIIGHALKNIFGIEQNFSAVKFIIMLFYIVLVYTFFLKRSLRAPKNA